MHPTIRLRERIWIINSDGLVIVLENPDGGEYITRLNSSPCYIHKTITTHSWHQKRHPEPFTVLVCNQIISFKYYVP